MLKYFQNTKKSAFRLETLQDYNEKEEVEEFLKTGKVDPQDNDDWHQIIKVARARNAIMQRVRIIKFPLTDYTKFEIEHYKYSQKAGEEIYIIEYSRFQQLSLKITKDFWLFDDTIALAMNYNTSGSFNGFTLPEKGTSRYLNSKVALLKNSIPLEDFVKTL